MAQTPATESVLFGWTFHQSHDQATVLFLVSQNVSSRDLDITIGSDYIIAAVRSQPPVIKARLYGHINIATSTWRIGDKGRSRSKRSSRSLRRPVQRGSAGAETQRSTASGSKDSRSSGADGVAAARGRDRNAQGAQDSLDLQSTGGTANRSPIERDQTSTARSDRTDYSPPPESSPQSYGSLEASTASLRSGSSYEVLQSGSREGEAGAALSASTGTGWSSSSSEVSSHDSSAGFLAISAVLSEPDALTSTQGEFAAHRRPRRVRSHLDASMVSAAADEVPERDIVSSVASLAATAVSGSSDPLVSESDEVSSGATNDAMSNPSTSSPSRPVTEASMIMDAGGSGATTDGQHPPAVRLVTIHLDKIDTGIWPLLVVGPAPLPRREADAAVVDAASARRLHPGTMAVGQPAPESIIAMRLQSAVRDKSDRRDRRSAERELARTLGEALGGSQLVEREAGRLGDSRSNVQSYLEGLSTTMDDPDRDEDDPEGPDDDDHSSMRPSTSRLSIILTASDDSTTVLGSRNGNAAAAASTRAELEGTRNAESEAVAAATTGSESDEVERLRELQIEAKFNADPTTLSLIGLRVANTSAHGAPEVGIEEERRSRRRKPSAYALPEAFEYFARSWRTGDIALATERLVRDYLPPLGSSSFLADVLPASAGRDAPTPPRAAEMVPQGSADTFRPGTDLAAAAASAILRTNVQRQRLIASLGGTRALARLYLSYARLQLPSSVKTRSPLAFPLGQLNSPFVAGPGAQRNRASAALKRKSSVVLSSSSSSRSRASSATPSHGGPSSRSGVSPSHRAGIASVDSTAGGGACPLPSPTLSTLGLGRRSPRSEEGGDKDGDRVDFLALGAAAAETAAALPGPLQFLEEAIKLDESVCSQIAEIEWEEALQIDDNEARRQSLERRCIEQAEEMGSLAGESQGGDLVFDSDSDVPRARARGDRQAKRGGKKSSQRLRPKAAASGLFGGIGRIFGGDGGGGGPQASSGRGSQHLRRNAPGEPYGVASKDRLASSMESEGVAGLPGRPRRRRARGGARSKNLGADQEAGMLAFVSGAALLSVALAGGVAAVSWWRRASGALPSSA